MPGYDAIVAGAGPAGAAAALTLARGGARVALLDRAPFPRDKPCGDLLGRAAVRHCLALGLDPASLDAFRVRGVRLRTPGGALVRGIAYRGSRFSSEACVVPRRRFDSALVEMAVAAGASLLTVRATAPLYGPDGAVVGVMTRHEGASEAEPRAPLLITADGWGSALARSLLGTDAARPAQRGIAIRCYLENLHQLQGRLHFFHEADLLPGCAWVFPVGEGRANVGLGVLVPKDQTPARLAERLERLIANPASPAAALLAGATRAGEMVSWPLALGWRDAPLSFSGAVLVGDAASLVSPLSGSGIAAALHSGREAGRVGLQALARGDTSRMSLLPYERAMRAAYRLRYLAERAGQALIADPGRLDLLGRAGMRAPYSQSIAARLLFNLG